ncbi:MAG: HIT family protein, partial [Patescibacteria group bacterium]|nr:HIT family protein [Patescibacteria group bacterium]
TKKVAPAVMKAADVDAFHFDINNGAGAGQIIFHTHFHIQPRSKEDGLKLWLGTPTDQDKLAKMAESIKKEL